MPKPSLRERVEEIIRTHDKCPPPCKTCNEYADAILILIRAFAADCLASVPQMNPDVCSQIFLRKICNLETCEKCDVRATHNAARAALQQRIDAWLKD